MATAVAVIGMGIFGREVAVSLATRGFAVLAVDSDPAPIDAVKDLVTQALILDTTDEHALYDAKVDEVAVAVVAIGTGHIENSILTTALLRHLGIPRIIARATNQLHERILRQVGADEVVNPEQDMGRKLAHQIAHPGLREVLTLTQDSCVAELPVPPSFVGQNLNTLDVRRKYGVTIVGVQRLQAAPGVDAPSRDDEVAPARAGEARAIEDARQMILNIDPDNDVFQEGDKLVVIGRERDVARLSGLG